MDLPVAEPPPAVLVREDANRDGALDVSDPITILLYLFLGPVDATCLDALDADDQGAIEITDAIYLLSFLFGGEPAPPAPHPDPGADPTTDDALDCRL